LTRAPFEGASQRQNGERTLTAYPGTIPDGSTNWSKVDEDREAGMSLLDLCSYLGLGAVGAVTINLLLGMLLSLRYSTLRQWPHRRLNLFALHRWTAYVAVIFTLTHPAVLLFLRTPRFRVIDVLWPVHSYLQPKLNLAGAGALYLLVIVLLSSLLRTRIARPVWRRLHYLVFPAAVLLLLHSILTDPNLKDGHPDLLDGGKIFVEAATLLSFAVVAIRIRLRGRGFRPALAGVRRQS
jgi:predicted ferric reductase